MKRNELFLMKKSFLAEQRQNKIKKAETIVGEILKCIKSNYGTCGQHQMSWTLETKEDFLHENRDSQEILDVAWSNGVDAYIYFGDKGIDAEKAFKGFINVPESFFINLLSEKIIDLLRVAELPFQKNIVAQKKISHSIREGDSPKGHWSHISSYFSLDIVWTKSCHDCINGGRHSSFFVDFPEDDIEAWIR